MDEQDLEDVTGGVGPFRAGFNNARFTFKNEFKANGIGAAFKSIRPAFKEGQDFGKRVQNADANRWRQENINAVINESSK